MHNSAFDVHHLHEKPECGRVTDADGTAVFKHVMGIVIFIACFGYDGEYAGGGLHAFCEIFVDRLFLFELGHVILDDLFENVLGHGESFLVTVVKL